MIYTVTFNPSLDYVLQLQTLIPGTINRTTYENVYPGGKGNNVSVVLANLGYANIAMGFQAGFTGESLIKMLREYGCQTDYIKLDEGFTRINVKVNAGEETEINGQGPVIDEKALTALFEKLDLLKKDDILVLAGSIPSTLPSDIYEKIMERLDGKEVRIVVDATGQLLLNVLKYHPFLIKPNNHELEEIFERTLCNKEEFLACARELQKKGAQNVLISLAGDGAILLTRDGAVYQSSAPKGEVLNSVGAGDSMVAGFLAGYLESGDYQKALRLGIAAGSATAFEYWLAEREKIMKLYESL